MLRKRSQAFTALILVALHVSVDLIEAKERDYSGYSVLRCEPQTRGQLAKLRALHLRSTPVDGIQFWIEPSGLNQTLDIMVSPEYRDELENKLNLWEIPNEEIINDLAGLIAKTSPPAPIATSNRNALFNSTLRAQMLSPDAFYRRYHPYGEIEAKVAELAAMDPRVTMETLARTSEGRNMYLVKVSSDPAARKPIILIDAGHHAREWISHATVTYLMESMVNTDIPRMAASSCWSEKCRQTLTRRTKLDLDDFDYWFVPVVNPDGYEFTHNHDRLWRKTRSVTSCGPAGGGVDPNRNYPFHWMEAGASPNPCSDIYAGAKSQSEPEVQAMVKLMDKNKDRIVMYISFHSYSQVILAPYGYARVKPDNYDDLRLVAGSWVESVAELRNTRYEFGTSSILLYPAAGGSDDYAHGAANISFAYTIELPDRGRRGFILPASEIIPVGQETVVGVKSMIKRMQQIVKARSPAAS